MVLAALATLFILALWAPLAAQPVLRHLRLSGDPTAAASLRGAAALGEAPCEPSLGGHEYHLLQAPERLDRAGLDRLRAAGCEPVAFIPDSAYIIRVAAGGARAVEGLAARRWSAPLTPGLKLATALDEAFARRASEAIEADAPILVVVSFWEGESARAEASELAAAGVTILQRSTPPDLPRLLIEVEPALLRDIAARGAVRWIEPAPVATLRNNSATGIVQSGSASVKSIWDKGLHGEGEVLGHIDSSLAMASCYFMDSVDNTPGPGHRKVVAYRGTVGASGHGTHTAGTLAGKNDSGSLANAGHAYEAKISHTGTIPGLAENGNPPPSSLIGLLTAAQDDGAYLHTNSWGDDFRTDYSAWCVDIDTFSWNNEDALVLFAVTNGNGTLKNPENAKNALAVGAAGRAPNENNHSTAGAGPTFDGRRKPEIYAPGADTISASTAACSTSTQTGTSMACPAITGSGALVRQYFREGFYPSGTATPADGFIPSGALLKAVLLNGTVDMTGIPGYPSTGISADGVEANREGWGRLLLDNSLFFDGDARELRVLDARRSNGDGLADGESDLLAFTLESPDEPLKVTLAWMEPPAAFESAAPVINDLNLEVTGPMGTVYRGNVFASGESTAGGVFDALNNVEMVQINVPAPGAYTARVIGETVNAMEGEQGFALVISGDLAPAAVGEIRFDRGAYRCDSLITVAVTDGNATGPLSVALTTDGGDSEAITLSEVGTGRFEGSIMAAAGSADPDSGTLEIAHGAMVTATYNDADAGSGPAVATAMAAFDCQAPTITEVAVESVLDSTATIRVEADGPLSGTAYVDRACGGSEFAVDLALVSGTTYSAFIDGLTPATFYRARVVAQDEVGNVVEDDNGGICYSFATKTRTLVFAADAEGGVGDPMTFDTDSGGPAASWSRTAVVLANSPPTAYFAPDIEPPDGQIGQDSRLVSPEIMLNECGGRLQFYHTYQFEPDRWDGGVIEISTNGGTDWTDIGQFIQSNNGYNGQIGILASMPPTDNPLFGRMGWTNGTLGDMVEVDVDLSSFTDTSIRLRWRLGADEFLGDMGWYVDDIRVFDLSESDFTPTSNGLRAY